MADAKSRYEIVNELTDKKTSLLDEVSTLDKKLLDQEEQINANLRAHIRAIEEVNRQNDNHQEDLKAQLNVNTKHVAARKEQLTLKIKAYEAAIEAIKAVSAGQEKA